MIRLHNSSDAAFIQYMNASKSSRDKRKIACFFFWHSFFVFLRLEEKPPAHYGSVKEGECLLSVPQVTYFLLHGIHYIYRQANAITPKLNLNYPQIVETCHHCFRLKMPFFSPGILRSFSFWSTGLIQLMAFGQWVLNVGGLPWLSWQVICRWGKPQSETEAAYWRSFKLAKQKPRNYTHVWSVSAIVWDEAGKSLTRVTLETMIEGLVFAP